MLFIHILSFPSNIYMNMVGLHTHELVSKGLVFTTIVTAGQASRHGLVVLLCCSYPFLVLLALFLKFGKAAAKLLNLLLLGLQSGLILDQKKAEACWFKENAEQQPSQCQQQEILLCNRFFKLAGTERGKYKNCGKYYIWYNISVIAKLRYLRQLGPWKM